MYRLAYRNRAGVESLVVNHSVAVGTTTKNRITSVRWYEVRSPNGTPTVFQQGTLGTSDGIHRWMGSIAMDRNKKRRAIREAILFVLFAASRIIAVITRIIPAYRSRIASEAKMPVKTQGAGKSARSDLSNCSSINIVRRTKIGSDQA